MNLPYKKYLDRSNRKLPLRRFKGTTFTTGSAAFFSLSCAKFWRLERGHKVSEFSDGAAKAGNLTVIKWLLQQGYRPNYWTGAAAAETGQVHVLQYLQEQGWSFGNNITICSAAARHGQLSALKFAHENGIPWYSGVCTEAANAGHLDILKYACENGVAFGQYDCTAAAKIGRLDSQIYPPERWFLG